MLKYKLLFCLLDFLVIIYVSFCVENCVKMVYIMIYTTGRNDEHCEDIYQRPEPSGTAAQGIPVRYQGSVCEPDR